MTTPTPYPWPGLAFISNVYQEQLLKSGFRFFLNYKQIRTLCKRYFDE